MRDSIHIDAAGRDVGGDEDTNRARFKILQRTEPLVLRAIGMDSARLNSAAFQTASDLVSAALGPGKNKNSVELLIAQEMKQQRGLQVWANFVGKLRDRLGRVRAPANLHNLGRLLELVGQLYDLP